MAKRLTADSEDGTPDHPTATHNVKAREEAIGIALEKLYQEDKCIEAALEKHVAAHREEKGLIKKRLRDDYELPTGLTNARYALYKKQRKAMENGDDKTLDVLRELFEIRPVGHQANWLEAAEKADAAGAAEGGAPAAVR